MRERRVTEAGEEARRTLTRAPPSVSSTQMSPRGRFARSEAKEQKVADDTPLGGGGCDADDFESYGDQGGDDW